MSHVSVWLAGHSVARKKRFAQLSALPVVHTNAKVHPFFIIFLSPPGRFFTHFSHVEIALHVPKIIRNRRPQLAFVEICSTQSVWVFFKLFFVRVSAFSIQLC